MADTFFDKIYKSKTSHTPDVLSCLANLSNDEVFTPPGIVNQMLDLLPQELFRDPNTTFLDPACKTGVFLREIAKRLIVGLQDKIPDLQQRIDHIFHKQLYGIAITELTSLLSRRSLYCSKYPNGEYSVSRFDTVEGNIRFRRIQHTWVGDKCKFCGASKDQWDRGAGKETHAYEFIHTSDPEKIFNMKFDVIISNPPYQLKTSGAQAQAIPIYNEFVMQAEKLLPKYIAMITPARWFTGGFGLEKFRKHMLNDKHIKIIHDFYDANDCFNGVEIKGGVCYFLWDKNYHGDCDIYSHESNEIEHSRRPLLEQGSDIFIRYNKGVEILRKVQQFKEMPITEIISAQRPFGFPTNFADFELIPNGNAKIYAYKRVGYLKDGTIISKNKDIVGKWKIFTPKAIGSGNSKEDKVKPIIGEPNSVCTETYIVFGSYDDRQTAENVSSYIRTKFFHFLLTLRKNTQDALARVYQFIPMQDFSKPWTDEELYKKYGLTKEEIDFIENMIKPME